MVSRATIEKVCPDCGLTFWLRPNQYNSGHLHLRTRCGVCREARARHKSAARSFRYRQRLKRRRHGGTAPVQKIRP